MNRRFRLLLLGVILGAGWPGFALSAVSIPLTVNMSEVVTVNTAGGTPRIPVDVGGNTRYATYTSGSGTSALTFTLTPTVGDVDLDGVTVSSPVDLNGGTIKDAAGNNATLTFTPPNTVGIKVDYPSLSMDFVADADGRYTLNGTAYNDLTSFLAAAGGGYTRASVGTYYDSSGVLQTAASGVPRFDYDPTTHVAKGILIEESRTNLLLNSAMSSLTSWTGSNSSIITLNNPGSLPAGASACIRNEVATGQVNGFTYQTLTLAAGSTYTFSAWVYVPSFVPSGKAFLDVWYTNAGWNYLTGTSITERDQWVRKSVTFTANATYTSHTVGIGVGSGSPGYQSYACFAQLEQGAFSTSFIPTTTVAVTRSSDSLTLPTGGWYNAATGTLATEFSLPKLGGLNWPGSASLDDGSSNNAIHLFIKDNGGDEKSSEIVNGSVFQFSSYGVAYTPDTTSKQAMYYGPNAARLANDGTLLSLDTSVSVPTVNTLRVGANRGNAKLNGDVARLKYYPLRAADTQLQLLTQ